LTDRFSSASRSSLWIVNRHDYHNIDERIGGM
jgi:hypothetical protein